MRTFRRGTLVVGLLAVLVPASNDAEPAVRVPQRLLLSADPATGAASYPPVVFDHAGHFFELAIACGACHAGRDSAAVDASNAFEIVGKRPSTIHALCIGCHEKATQASNESTAPIACEACHVPGVSAPHADAALEIPVRIRLSGPKAGERSSSWIKAVDFPHFRHAYATDCRSCHHIEPFRADRRLVVFACSECHASPDVNDRRGYYRVIHGNDPKSCIGCHRASGGLAANDHPPLSCTASCHPEKAAP